MDKFTSKNLKATIVSSHHTIQINEQQVDIFYEFNFNLIQVFVDGTCLTISHYNPSRLILSYTNIIDVATTYYLSYLHKQKQQHEQQQRQSGEMA